MHSTRPTIFEHRQARLRDAALLTAALLLGACQAPSPSRPPAAVPAERAAPSPDTPAATTAAAAQQAGIDQLLADAELALELGRLTTPEADNAFDRFLHVLVLDPDNARARHGLERVVESYLSLALQAAQRRDRAAAEYYLRQASQIDPRHPSLGPTTERLQRALQDVERQVLDRAALAQRAPAMQQQLQALATRAKREGLFTVIVAPNDASGRWIYQVMNAAPPQQRLRAALEIGLPPAVELRPLDAASTAAP